MRTVICSDSSLALKSIMSTGSDNYTDGKQGILVYICWILAYIGIAGNEIADKLAKKPLKTWI